MSILGRARCLVLLLGALLVSAGMSNAAQPKFEVDTVVGKVQGWSIGVSTALDGCVAAATFSDQTTVWIGFGGGNDAAYLAFMNPKWVTLAPERKYDLQLQPSGQQKWRGRFLGVARGRDKGLFASNLKSGFIIDLARAGALEVRLDNTALARVSLEGSSAALEAALQCQIAYAEKRDEQGPRSAAARPREGASKKGGGSGTGFFVSRSGHVLTNHHVVDGCGQIEVAQVGAPAVRASVLAVDQTNDLALLHTGLRPAEVPAFAPRPRVGENIFIFGFPLSGILATGGNFTVGNITATAGLADDSRQLQVSAPVQPGNSGGPLMDQNGNILGVVVSKLNALRMAAVTNDLAQNVNFAIKSSVAATFLDVNDVAIPGPPATNAMASADLAERAKTFTVKIQCQ